MATKAFTPAQLASNIAFQTAKKTKPSVSTTPAPLQTLLKPKQQQSQAISTNNIPATPQELPATGAGKKSLSEFGDIIKAKYPQYSGMDSTELGKKMLEKYPQYADKVTLEEPSRLSKVAGTAWAILWGITTGIPLLAGAGKVAEYAWKKLYQATLQPTQQEAEAIQSFRAWTSNARPRIATETAIDLPFFTPWQGRSATSKFWGFGTKAAIWEQSEAAAKQLRSTKVQPVLNKAKTTINIQGTIKELQSEIERMAKQDPDKLEEYKQAYDELAQSFADKKYGNLVLQDVHTLKSWLQGRTPQKFYKWKEITNAYQELRWQLASKLVNKLHNAIKKDYGEDSANLYREYANLKSIKDIWPKALTQWGRKWWAWWVIDWLVSTIATPATTTIGKTLYKWWKAAQVPQQLLNKWFAKVLEKSRAVKFLSKWGRVLSLLADGSLIPWTPANMIEPVNPISYNPDNFIKIKWMWGAEVQKSKLKYNDKLKKKVVETDLWFVDEQGNLIR